MRVGTKSILFGAHQFLIHPWFVAIAWWKLYGIPLDPRLWLSFFVHDLGYFGKPNMDGLEGERHVEFGARLMQKLFGKKWGDFCRYHSRFYAKKDKQHFSKLCVADKLAIVLTPAWLYIPMATWSGEINEYMNMCKEDMGKYNSMDVYSDEKKRWYSNVQSYLKDWVAEHKDGRDDTWTPEVKE